MKLTIILTLKNRSKFTIRWMNYMNSNFCKYKIIIADGGDDYFIELQLSNKKNYPNLSYDYYKFPYDVDLNAYYNKINKLINLVDTDYVLQADNDDFYVLEEISNLIDFLDINTNYVGARGALVNLYFNGIKDCGKNATCTKYILNKVFSSSIEQDSTLDRIDFLFKNMSLYDFYSNWYCVFRTTSLQKTWNSILPLKISEMVVTEISFHIYILSYGKLKIFDNPFYIRQSGSSIHGDTLVIGNEFLERFFIENNFVLDLDKALSNAEFLNYKINREIILKSVAYWFQIFIVNLHNSNLKINLIKKIYRKALSFFIKKNNLKLKNLDKYLLVDYE